MRIGREINTCRQPSPLRNHPSAMKSPDHGGSTQVVSVTEYYSHRMVFKSLHQQYERLIEHLNGSALISAELSAVLGSKITSSVFLEKLGPSIKRPAPLI